jgi:cytosine/adenosine deaminase-related metal-dependent hydrolase
MSYRKFRASQLFNGYEVLDDQHVLIADERGKMEAIVPLGEAGDGVQFLSGILSPGFINCHCHLELSHMKGMVPEKTGMTDFILAVLKSRSQPEEAIVDAIERAEKEMLQNGIVAVGDICNTTHSLLQKKKGRLYYHNFIEAIGFDPSQAEQRFSTSSLLFNDFARQYGLPIESNSMVPHAPYSVSPELFHRIINFPGNHILTMHNQESEPENELFISKTGDFLRLYAQLNLDLSFFQSSGKTSLQTVFPYFKKNQTIILVHNVTTSERDLRYLANVKYQDQSNGFHQSSPDLYFCLCPKANRYIGNSLPNVDLLRNSNYPIVIGTDSLASNNQLNILEELKAVQQQSPDVGLQELLQWATLNGAKALQLEERLGSFEKEKTPGILLITETRNNLFTARSQVKRLL